LIYKINVSPRLILSSFSHKFTAFQFIIYYNSLHAFCGHIKPGRRVRGQS